MILERWLMEAFYMRKERCVGWAYIQRLTFHLVVGFGTIKLNPHYRHNGTMLLRYYCISVQHISIAFKFHESLVCTLLHMNV